MDQQDTPFGLTTGQYDFVTQLKHQFRRELEQYPDVNTVWHLARFCRARKWAADKTTKMLESYFAWRASNDYTEICKYDFSPYTDVIRKNYISGQYFTDKEGRPVVIEQVGLSNAKELFNNLDEEQIKFYYIQFFQRLLHIQLPICSQLAGRRVDKIVQIFDMRQLNVGKLFDNAFIKFIKFMAKIGQDYYPEILHVSYIVNTPIVFYGTYNALKYLLDASTRERIRIFSGPATKELLEVIDADKLPVSLGGSCGIDLRDSPGPWREEIEHVKAHGGFMLRDRSPEYEFFYTREEKAKVEGKKGSKSMNLIQSIEKENDTAIEVRRLTPILESMSSKDPIDRSV